MHFKCEDRKFKSKKMGRDILCKNQPNEIVSGLYLYQKIKKQMKEAIIEDKIETFYNDKGISMK